LDQDHPHQRRRSFPKDPAALIFLLPYLFSKRGINGNS
jgi:hypothetical protein